MVMGAVVKAVKSQELYLLRKKDGKIRREAVLPVRFVPMTREKK